MRYSATAYYTRCICILLLHFCVRHVDLNGARRPTVCVWRRLFSMRCVPKWWNFPILEQKSVAQGWQCVGVCGERQVETTARSQNDGADTTVQLGVWYGPAWMPAAKFIYFILGLRTIRLHVFQLVFVSVWCVGVSGECAMHSCSSSCMNKWIVFCNVSAVGVIYIVKVLHCHRIYIEYLMCLHHFVCTHGVHPKTDWSELCLGRW